MHSLLLAGMSPGAAIAYLIAGPATNLGELLVLKRQFGARAMWLFAGGLFIIALTGGIIADQILYRNYTYQPSALASGAPTGTCCVSSFMPSQDRPRGFMAAAVHVPTWHWPFVVILLITMACGLVRRVRARFMSPPPDQQSSSELR